MLDSFTKQKIKLEDNINRVSQVAQQRGLQNPVDKIKEITAKLNNDTFFIAVFGGFSSGKSTFLNALIGEKIFPSLHTPTTAAINYLSFDVVPSIFVNYKSKKDIEANKQTGVPEYASAKTSFAKLGTKQEIPISDLSMISRENVESIYIKDINIKHPSEHLKPRGVVWVDTPGTDSVIEYHKSVTYGLIDKADAIFFFMYAPIPFKDSDWKFFEDIKAVRNAIKVDKFFFVVNAIDAIEEQPVEEIVAFIRNQLVKKAGVERPQMLPVSAKLALYAKKKEKAGLTVGEEREYKRMLYNYTDRVDEVSTAQALEFSRFPELQEVLSQFLTKQKAVHLLNSSVDRAIAQASDVLRDISMQRLALEKSVEELDAIISQRLLPDLQAKQKAIAETVDQLNDELGRITPSLGKLENEASDYLIQAAAEEIDIDQSELEDVFNRNIYASWKDVEGRIEKVTAYHYREIQKHFDNFSRTVINTMNPSIDFDYSGVARDLEDICISDFIVSDQAYPHSSDDQGLSLGMAVAGGILAFLLPGGLGLLGGAALGYLGGKIIDGDSGPAGRAARKVVDRLGFKNSASKALNKHIQAVKERFTEQIQRYTKELTENIGAEATQRIECIQQEIARTQQRRHSAQQDRMEAEKELQVQEKVLAEAAAAIMSIKASLDKV